MANYSFYREMMAKKSKIPGGGSCNEVKNIKKGAEGKDLHFFPFEELFNIPLTPKLQKAFERQKESLKFLLRQIG